MRKLACLAAFSLAVATAGACASVTDDEGSTSEDALTSLTVAQCKTPTVHTSAKADASGAVIAGSAHTTLSGCIVGSQGETGDAVLTRLTTLLADTERIGSVKDEQGAPVFAQFNPGAKHGTLATAVTQDFGVTLAMNHAPYTKLHTSQTRPAGQPYSLSIVNSTALSANVAFFTVTVVNPGEFTLTLQAKAASNGIMLTGASDIILQQQQDQAASASVLVSDLFRWVASELAKTAPAPHPVMPAPVSDAGAAHDASGDASGMTSGNDGGHVSSSDASPE